MVTRGFKNPVAEVNMPIDAVFVADAIVMNVDQEFIFGDICETIELQQSGSVSGIVHASRSFLRFMFDPEEWLHKP